MSRRSWLHHHQFVVGSDHFDRLFCRVDQPSEAHDDGDGAVDLFSSESLRG